MNRTAIVAAIVMSLSTVAAYALPNYTGFTPRSTGYVVTASTWNSEFSNFITHMNTYCIATLNLLQGGKGRILTGDGSNIHALTNAGAGDDNKVLTLDSSAPDGLKWAAPANQIIANRDCSGRLTPISGKPYPGTSTTPAASTIYYAPAAGNTIDLYEGSQWKKHTFAQISIPLTGLTADKNYDVFIYDNDNNDTAETADVVVWTDNSNRATALVLQDGVYVKTGATNRRYVGTFRTNGTGLTTDDSTERLIWNYYNRSDTFMIAGTTTDSWSYSGTAFRPLNGNSAVVCDVVIGVAEDIVHADFYAQASGSGDAVVGIGIDQSTSQDADLRTEKKNSSSGEYETLSAHKYLPLAAGFHKIYPLEKAITGTVTFYGDDGGDIQTGLKVVTRM